MTGRAHCAVGDLHFVFTGGKCSAAEFGQRFRAVFCVGRVVDIPRITICREKGQTRLTEGP